MHDYWHKQTADKPLFPDLLWSRPENKNTAGKLLIVGGNVHGFAAAAEAYNETLKASIGTVRVLLPDSLQKTVGNVFQAGEYAPSTPSGSFGSQALAEFLALGEWADGILLAGDFGHNSETAILLEKFIEKYDGQLTLTGDSLDYFLADYVALLARPVTTLVPTFGQLQKLATQSKFRAAFTSQMDFLHLIDAIHEFSDSHTVNVLLAHQQTTFLAVSGYVATTKREGDTSSVVSLAAHAAVWWLQNPSKTFEALTTSLLPGAA
jgi:NAD(P)H-hydrate repair Nnr-like enzyme with NAD(P)H-hydrate dehydratase domain